MKPTRLTSLPQVSLSQVRPLVLVKTISRRALRIAPEVGLRGSAAVLALFAFCGFNPQALAASENWLGTGPDAVWTDTADWSGGVAPGATTGNNTDIATFNTALASGTIGGVTDPITNDNDRTLGGITFDTANAGPYVIGVNGGNLLEVGNTSTGTSSIQLTATVLSAEVIAAPLQIRGYSSSNNTPYFFTNNATSTAATLTFTGLITANISSSRPDRMTLGGSNTGNNLISGVFSDPSSGQVVALLTKTGVGTWILSGANVFSGSGVTSASTTSGIQVNQGTLVLENNAALGTTAGSINNYINNGGTLQLNSSGPNGIITLGSNLTLQLQSGGNLSNSGTDTVASITNVSSAAAVSATLSTVNATDVFTIGQAANGFTGGASDTVMHIAGPGTVLLNNASNYAGNWSIDAGTLELGNVTALGSLESITNISTGTLELNGLSPTLSALAGSGGTVENGSSSTAATLNYSNGTTTNTFLGAVVNGGTASLALSKNGAGTLNLSGNNTYSGGTTLLGGALNFSGNNNFGAGGVTVSAGTLTFSGSNAYTGATNVNSGKLILNTSSAQLGETAITVANGATLAADPGAGNVQIGTSAATITLNPGSLLDLTNGSSSVGTLTLEAPGAGVSTVLNLLGTSSNPDNLTFGVGSTGTADELIVNNGVVGVAASSPQTNINLAAFGSSTPTTLTGIPLLSDPSGILSLADFSLETEVISTFGGGDYAASLSLNGADNELLLNLAHVVVSVNYFWTGKTSASWSVSGNFATDTSGTTSQGIAPNNSTNIFETGTAAHAGTFTQTLDGSYTINSLTFTGATSNPVTIAGGAGTNFLTINGANGFTDTNTNNSYAAGTGLVVEAGSVANTISANLKLGGNQTWELDNASSAPLTVSGVIADGGGSAALTKIGVGTLILTASNTYSGGTTVNGGTLMLGPGGNLSGAGSLTVAGSGAVFDLGGNNQTVSGLSDGSVATGVITSSTGIATLTVNNIAADSYSGTLTDNNAVNGARLGLTEGGSSTLTLSGSNNYTGLTTVNSGTLVSATNAALGSSTSASGGLLMDPAVGTAIVDFTSGSPAIASLASSGAGLSDVVLGNGTASTPTTLTVGGGGQTTVFSGVISDLSALHAAAIGSLVVNGGVLTLGGADTFTGTTVISSGGALVVNNTLALQDSLVNYNNQGGTLSFGTITAATFGGLEGAQNISLVNGSAGVVALTISNGSGTTYSGALSGGGSLTVSNGTETFSGTNDYTGTTTFSAGTQTLTGSIGNAVTPSGAITLTSDTLDVSGGSIYASTLSNSTSTQAAVINITSNGVLNLSGALNINTGNPDVNGLLSIVSGSVTAGSLTIGRDGTNDGATAPVQGGTADGVYVNGGTLSVGVGTNGILSVGAATGDNSTANMRMDSGSVTVGGVTDVTNDAAGRFTVLDINGGTFTDEDTSGIGVNVGSNANTGLDAELLVRGTGVLNTPAITLGNVAQLAGGTDEFQAIGGTVNIGAGGIVEISGSTSSPTFVVALGSATGVPVIAATASWSSSVPITLTNSSTATTPTFQTASGANITLSGVLSGGGGVTTSGSGVLTLSNAETYTGATTVGAGTVVVSGSIAGTASVAVATGANLEVDGLVTPTNGAVTVSGELSGNGSINGATVTTGELAPGDTLAGGVAGTLTSSGNVSLSTNSTFSVRIGLSTGLSSDADQLNLSTGSGTFSIADSTTVLQIITGGAEHSSALLDTLYVIVNGGASATGVSGDWFSNATASGAPVTAVGGDVFDVFYGVNATNNGPGNDVVLELVTVAVPEPGTWASLIAGIGMLVAWQRSRRRRA